MLLRAQAYPEVNHDLVRGAGLQPSGGRPSLRNRPPRRARPLHCPWWGSRTQWPRRDGR